MQNQIYKIDLSLPYNMCQYVISFLWHAPSAYVLQYCMYVYISSKNLAPLIILHPFVYKNYFSNFIWISASQSVRKKFITCMIA